ncbi:hypothetical protein HDN1F_09830 [gamma proteobacterium HdN1]|nr:hypothetical protein HDN1F_09830 [gamma proteobacterium HdN1]
MIPMVQVDVFWAYGWGASLAVAGGKMLLAEKKPFESEFFVKTLLFLSLFWAPTGMLLLIRHPSWETMQVAENFSSMSEWLILAFGLTNITQGIVGFWVGLKLLEKGHHYLAHLNWLLGYFGMFFILLYGWDGLGYDRFLYDRDMLPGSPAWTAGAGTGGTVMGALSSLVTLLTSGVAITLYIDGLWLIPPFALLVCSWFRRNGSELSYVSMVLKYIAGVFVLGFGSAAVSAVCVAYTGEILGVANNIARAQGLAEANTAMHILSYFIGLPLSFALLYALVFRPGMPGHRLLTGLTSDGAGRSICIQPVRLQAA